MVGIQGLLLNIFLILCSISLSFLIVLNQKRGIARIKKKRKFVIFFLAAFTIILCMSFPFSVLPGYVYDLRIIPLLLGMLYGGYLVGGILTGVLFLYRYYLGGDGFFTTIYAYSIIVCIAGIFMSSYKRGTTGKKFLIGLNLSFFAAFLVTVISYVRMSDLGVMFDKDTITFFTMYCLLHVVAMWIAIYIIEMMHENLMLRKEMEQAEKMYVLGELAASIAHEIRNPMTVIRGFIQLLNNQEAEKKNQDYMKLVINELDRAESIIEDYLSYARPQIEKNETIEMGELVKQISNIIEGFAIMENVKINHDIQDALLVKGDSKKLGQALLNILKNGVEAMPGGGTLQIHSYKRDNCVIVDITDTGVGMGREELERLGNPFYSTKDKGTGLGLMVSYRIIETMNGKVQVYSKKGRGTKFSILLPAAQESDVVFQHDIG
ncbi:two-component system sporulation sensor kinase B [Bacillus fengqiuensis]|nr:two-component system sporulation sensor kinase B [Bacillus fengqiuensis]